MSVTATPALLRRRAGVAAGAALLTLAVTGCSGLGRTAVGPVVYTTGRDKAVAVHSPSVRGCHRMAPAGARRVENLTLVDIVLYTTRDCTGPATTYVSTRLSDVNAGSAPAWRSYRFVQ
ncbi:hypothetical protein [Streptomyces sp. NPDC014623]|uniref:hypothetical protein n=1 Tax=Streptomyces sp. NPDC014623 TaxID=3364875 RepID=UPI0036FD2C7E